MTSGKSDPTARNAWNIWGSWVLTAPLWIGVSACGGSGSTGPVNGGVGPPGGGGPGPNGGTPETGGGGQRTPENVWGNGEVVETPLEGIAFQPMEFRFATGAVTGTGQAPDQGDPSPDNPWLDWRMDLVLEGPTGRSYLVPGFFAGDGNGGSQGDVWCVRFSPPNVPGLWLGNAVLRKGDLINVASPLDVGGAVAFSEPVRFRVLPFDDSAPGLLSRGPIRSDGLGRLRDARGQLFVKAGVGSPENFLGYAGFHGATDGVDGGPAGETGGAPDFLHAYSSHVQDWRAGDPDWGSIPGPIQGLGRGIIGALNALGDMGANALYVMPMNLGGDGRDTFPFASNSGGGLAPADPDHVLQYDVRRLDQWNAVLGHAQGLGILVQFVLAEREPANIAWLGGAADVRRRLFLKQMVAHFGHHPGLEWTLCEENAAPGAATFAQFTPAELSQIAAWIRGWDVDAHPRSVHVDPNDLDLFEAILDDGSGHWVDAISLQVHGDEPWNGDLYGNLCEEAAAMFLDRTGRKVVVHMDEPGYYQTGAASELHPDAWAGVPAAGAEDRRRRALYDSLFSGAGIAWYFGLWDLPSGGGDLTTEDFRTRETLLRQTASARRLIEETFDSEPEFGPADDLWLPTDPVARLHPIYGDAEILAARGGPLLAYFPSFGETAIRPPGTIGPIDTDGAAGSEPGAFEAQWIRPETGIPAGAAIPFDPTLPLFPEAPVAEPDLERDWLLVLRPR